MKIKIRHALFAAAFLAAAGCTLFPEPPPLKINYYDLGVPEKTGPPSAEIKIGKVDATPSYSQKMVFRESGNLLRFDECNRWASSPTDLLKTYLTGAFGERGGQSAPEKTKKLTLSATILRMECNLPAKTADFSVKYELSGQKSDIVLSGIYSASAQSEEATAGAFALKMAEAVRRTLQQLNEDLGKIR